MSDGDAARRRLASVRRVLFGDRLGFGLFLGTLCFVALTWRVGFFITDSYAVANTLVNVADGHLYLSRIEYSLTLGSSQPGLHLVDGRVYGRNYGQVYLALPVYLALDALSPVVDLRVLAAGGTSLALLGAAHQFGGVLDRRPAAVVLGSLAATALFVSNVALASALDPRWAAPVALQTTTALGAGAIAVALYRLLWATSGRRVGVAVAAVAVLGTPLGLWATIPKRHVLTAALVAVTLYAFYRCRTDDPRARGVAYATAGFTASVHGPVGLAVLALLAVVDLSTVPTVRRHDVTIAAVGIAVGLVPFLATNVLISGDPLLAPRWLPSFNGGTIGPGGVVQTGTDSGNATGTAVQIGTDGNTTGTTVQTGTGGENTTTVRPGADGGNATGTGDGGGPGLVVVILGILSTIAGRAVDALAAVTDPSRLYHVFVRSGNVPGLRYGKNDFAVVELSLFESAPVLPAALLGLAACVRQLTRPLSTARRWWSRRSDPAAATDLLAATWLLALTAAYLPRLPLFSQITVRYLLVTVPLWLYLLGRAPPVRNALSHALGRGLAALAVGATLGTVLFAGVLVVVDPALGEAMQLQALVNLAVAAVALAAVVAGDRTDRPAVGAVGIGLAGAAGAVLVVLAGGLYFPYGPTLLPVTDWVAELLPVL
jgi:4-amino-4-deoxy-L-arabinose transferase-like glycosyltransferase